MHGIEIGVDQTGDLFAVVDGGTEEDTYYSGLLEVGIEFDLESVLGWPATRAFVLGIGTFGRDPGDGAGSVHAPSNLANIPTGKVLEAWLEREFMDGRLAVLGGLYGVDSEFDVKETAGVFINGGFGTGLDLSETGQYLEGLSGFLRVGVADETVNLIGSYAGAGLVYTGLFPGRAEDVLGLGVSAAFNGDDYKSVQAEAGAPVDDSEIVIELSYWMPLLPWFSLQLDAQHISNPATDPTLDDALLLGLRYQLAF